MKNQSVKLISLPVYVAILYIKKARKQESKKLRNNEKKEEMIMS